MLKNKMFKIWLFSILALSPLALKGFELSFDSCVLNLDPTSIYFDEQPIPVILKVAGGSGISSGNVILSASNPILLADKDFYFGARQWKKSFGAGLVDGWLRFWIRAPKSGQIELTMSLDGKTGSIKRMLTVQPMEENISRVATKWLAQKKMTLPTQKFTYIREGTQLDYRGNTIAKHKVIANFGSQSQTEKNHIENAVYVVETWPHFLSVTDVRAKGAIYEKALERGNLIFFGKKSDGEYMIVENPAMEFSVQKMGMFVSVSEMKGSTGQYSKSVVFRPGEKVMSIEGFSEWDVKRNYSYPKKQSWIVRDIGQSCQVTSALYSVNQVR